MRTSLVILLLFSQFFFRSFCCAQNDKIDSLKKILDTLIDTVKVDCLNQLSLQYMAIDKRDFAENYANLAYNEAERLHYVHGIAVSFCRKSEIARHFYNDFGKSETLGKESLQWYDRTGNKEGIGDLYYHLCSVAFAESKFEEAIDYWKKRFFYAKQDELEMMNSDLYIGGIYGKAGDYEKAFLIGQRAYDYASKNKDKISISACLWYIASLYELIEDYPSALRYFREMWQINDEEITKWRIANDCDTWVKMEFAEIFSHLCQFDSAWHYYHLFKPEKDQAIYQRVYWVSVGETYFLQKDYLHALQNFQLGLSEHTRLNDRNEMMRTLLDIGKTYLALNNDSAAIRYGREGLSIAFQTKAKQILRDGYQILYSVYDRLNEKDSANFYFRKYTTVKDQVLNDQTKAKFTAYNYEQQFALINKEKEINQQQLKIKNQQIQQASFQKKILAAGIIALFIISVLIVRSVILKRRNERQQLEHEIEIQKLETEKTKTDLQKEATKLEMQALRAQMNPHFIFNSLNSVNMFILENNKLQASEYLSKFSRLVRLILQNSQEAFIPLKRELEALELYLKLESLRFSQKFEYKLAISDVVETTTIKVPPLIIQPYAENAIWHGLMHKKEKGHLEIELYIEKDSLFYKIRDDGIGRKKAAELKSKSASAHRSMGMRITTDRLAMLQKQNKTSVTITDLVLSDNSLGGTEVLIEVPFVYD
jgi:hypothetical protein